MRQDGSSEAGVLQNGFLVQGWPLRSKGHNGLLETACSNSPLPQNCNQTPPLWRLRYPVYIRCPVTQNPSSVSGIRRRILDVAGNAYAWWQPRTRGESACRPRASAVPWCITRLSLGENRIDLTPMSSTSDYERIHPGRSPERIISDVSETLWC